MIKKTVLHDREVEYTIKKSARARRLRVAVYYDAGVVITTPLDFADDKIEKFLKERASWILEKIRYFTEYGKVGKPASHNDYRRNKRGAYYFVKKKVEEFGKILDVSFQHINIKNMKTRWGSCTCNKNINFNYKVLSLPEKLAEYVIVHEMCHLKEFNHSRKFWSLVEKAIPDYKDRVKDLRKNFF